ncbi:unnamed protein product [Schistosoma margrebowiei]|uniref:Uncharacterized protein n=1 Tax=Schistosoma margrebowiei TaxID=48269 RepID=A0A183LSK2_9TREM|nr:unnamed protein product [Schistosoma margrebowiei]
MWSILAVAATSAFSASAGILSGPAALPLLICLMTMLISSIVGGPTFIGRSVGAASMLGGFSGAGRFKSSFKCSTHLFRCSSMLAITSPSLLFTGRSGLRRFPESFFVVSYNCLMFPTLAAFSAVFARSSTYLRL